MYFGLMPGLIYNKGLGEETKKEIAAVQMKFAKEECSLVWQFRSIVASLVRGCGDLMEYQCSLDRVGASSRIRWSPFHFQRVMENPTFRANETIGALAAGMATLCRQLYEVDERSTNRAGWENLFILILLARCHERGETMLVPWQWLQYQIDVEVFYNQYDSSKRGFADCENWTQLKEGIIFGDKLTFSIYYFPPDSKFQPYDALLVWGRDERMLVYGYQFATKGKAYRPFPVEESFKASFLISESPPQMTTTNKQGWCVPSGGAINEFYGEYSGKHWTPQKWATIRSG